MKSKDIATKLIDKANQCAERLKKQAHEITRLHWVIAIQKAEYARYKDTAETLIDGMKEQIKNKTGQINVLNIELDTLNRDCCSITNTNIKNHEKIKEQEDLTKYYAEMVEQLQKENEELKPEKIGTNLERLNTLEILIPIYVNEIDKLRKEVETQETRHQQQKLLLEACVKENEELKQSKGGLGFEDWVKRMVNDG